jgi:tRNA-specific 2-thiouridylase
VPAFTSSVDESAPTATAAGAEVLQRLRCWPGEHRVAVGLSGGVDSSLTAALLVAAGWEVEGLTLWLMSGKGACCAEGLVDAAGICEQLGVPHHVVDSREHFQQQIVDFLVQGYAAGVTPLPCSRCNREVKFGPMLAWAASERRLSRIATGHYARVRHGDAGEPLPVPGDGHGRHQLLRGRDVHKDQSYFLYDLPQDVLGQLVFPLGELTKPETRAEAAWLGLRTAEKPESQDLCLADHHGSMRAFLDAYLPPRQGEIVLNDGTVVGHHDGLEHFTIGQRKGLGVAWREPLHVVRLDGAMNRVVVATRSEAARAACTVGAVNWVSMAPPVAPIKVMAQVRYRSAPEPALLTPLPASAEDAAACRPHRCRLEFVESQFSITPGQAAVFYAGEVLLGGGLIDAEAMEADVASLL